MSLPAFQAPAETAPSQAWGLTELMHEFGAVSRSDARYVERRYLSMLKAPLESSGTLTYVAPRTLRKETLQPQHELLVVDGDVLTIEKDGERHTLNRDDYPQIWAFIEGIRATLAGDLPDLQAVYYVSLQGNAADWQLLLQPRDLRMQEIVQTIRITGSGAHIKRLVTQERDGDRTEMSIVETAP